jgi:hypothetical protein
MTHEQFNKILSVLTQSKTCKPPTEMRARSEVKFDEKVKQRTKSKKLRRPPPLPIGFNALGIDQCRSVLYRNFHDVSGKVYLCEISRNKTKVFIVLFTDYQNPNSFIADSLPEKLAFSLF